MISSSSSSTLSMKEKVSFPLLVKNIHSETDDAKSISFNIPETLKERFIYQPGQFISLFVKINGEELIRSYSLSSCPQLDTDFSIMVKKVPGGKVSTYLNDQLKVGDTLWCTPPSGHFFTFNDKSNNYLLIAAGSGITPLYSILKHLLFIFSSQKTSQKNSATKIVLIYCNRHPDQVIYATALEELKRKYSSVFHLIHVISRSTSPLHAHNEVGRLDHERLIRIHQSFFSTPFEDFSAYLCGPLSFMEQCQKTLISLGVTIEKIHQENFGMPTKLQYLEGLQSDGSLIIGEPLQDPNEKPEIITAKIDGETVQAEANSDLNILESLMNAGHNPPYSCMSGACMACMAHLEEGRVYLSDPGILNEDNINKREILTCQAVPLSRYVKICYSN